MTFGVGLAAGLVCAVSGATINSAGTTRCRRVIRRPYHTDADVAGLSSRLGHEPLVRAYVLRAIGAGERVEILHAAAQTVSTVKHSFLGDRHLVQHPEPALEG